MKKTAIVLFNLGGPDTLPAVKPFLFNLFSDPAIIRLPQPFRYLIARLISGKREKTAQDIYTQLGGGSPILPNTKAQAQALENQLTDIGYVRCFIAMRYWHPFVEETIQDVIKFAPDEIVLLPLYPQFSTTTTDSSLKSWSKVAQKLGVNIPTKMVCCYPQEAGFIDALASSVLSAYEIAKTHGLPRILFSAHGLPEKIVKGGDPYQWQCEQTLKALVQKLNIPNLDYAICYQSRVGPMKWIGPSTDQEILRAGATKTPLIVVPIAFVSEHSETLVEIDIEYRHLAIQNAVPYYAYVPTVSIDPKFISGLANLVRKAQSSAEVCISDAGGRICPKEFSGCCRNL